MKKFITEKTVCKNRRPSHGQGAVLGFSLFEVIIAIALTSVILAAFTSGVATLSLMGRSSSGIQAALLIQEEIDALHSLPYTELLDRTDGNPLGIAVQRGGWSTQEDVTAPSGTHVLKLTEPAAALVGETGLVLLPGNQRDDLTVSAKIKIDAASVAGWQAGLVFRYRDAENYYRLRLTSGGLAVDEIIHGTATTVGSYSQTVLKDTWYTIQVTVVGDSIVVARNGTNVISATGNALAIGESGFFTGGSALVAIDDVTVTNAEAVSENFDAVDVGELPTTWKRFSYVDLPSGGATLTISDYLGSNLSSNTHDDTKEVLVEISWNDGRGVKTATGQTLIKKP